MMRLTSIGRVFGLPLALSALGPAANIASADDVAWGLCGAR